MTKEDLIIFENEVARRYRAGEICGPVHLGSGNEDQLLEIFKNISTDDYKLCSWRNHLHALLSGIPPDELMRQILAGRSMHINSPEHRFYSSSIAGGILPIAVGLGIALKRKIFIGDYMTRCRCGHIWEEHDYEAEYERECLKGCGCYDFESDYQRVWCFVGDTTAEMGIFHESLKYVQNFDLPVTFVIEDNGKSVETPTAAVWGKKTDWTNTPKVIWYEYELGWPHHGIHESRRPF